MPRGRTQTRSKWRSHSTRPFDVERKPQAGARPHDLVPVQADEMQERRRLGPDSHIMGIWLGERITRLRVLTEHPLYPAIHGRLVAGISSYRVAAWILQRVGPEDPFAKRTTRSLARTLQKYAKLLPKSAFLPQSLIEDLVRGAEIDIDVLQELAGLIVLQKQRITMAAKMESRLQIPVEQVRRETETLANLLRQMRDTQIAFGYVPGMLQPVLSVNAYEVGSVTHESSRDEWMIHHPPHMQEMLPLLNALSKITGDDPVQ
jgi:hypothetical protein